jgi:alpha-tubulin suppressor-like RCC1 family protein
MSSLKIKEVDDGVRIPMTEITTIPKSAGKVRQVQFSKRRMFVLTEKGQCFVYIIEVSQLKRDEMFAKTAPEFTGELLFDNAILIKDLPSLKMIACGQNHFLGLDKNGKVWAMGDDTFGQCGQSKGDR